MNSNTNSLHELPGLDLIDAGDYHDLQEEILRFVGDAIDRLLACNELPKAVPGGFFGFSVADVAGDVLDSVVRTSDKPAFEVAVVTPEGDERPLYWGESRRDARRAFVSYVKHLRATPSESAGVVLYTHRLDGSVELGGSYSSFHEETAA